MLRAVAVGSVWLVALPDNSAVQRVDRTDPEWRARPVSAGSGALIRESVGR